MPEWRKEIGMVIAYFAVAALIFWMVWPWSGKIGLYLVDERDDSGHLEVVVRNEVGGALAGLFALVVAIPVLSLLERLINLYGLPGNLWPSRQQLVDDGVVTVELWGFIPSSNSKIDSCLFQAQVAGGALQRFLRRRDKKPLLIHDDAGMCLKFERRNSVSLETNLDCEQPVIVTLVKEGRTDRAFDLISPGRYCTNQNASYSNCQYQLHYRGCEETAREQLLFKGLRLVMRGVFYG